jgi:hypothetical protein
VRSFSGNLIFSDDKFYRLVYGLFQQVGPIPLAWSLLSNNESANWRVRDFLIYGSLAISGTSHDNFGQRSVSFEITESGGEAETDEVKVMNSYDIAENFLDTDIQIVSGDLYKIWHVGNEQTVTFVLPNVSAEQKGAWIKIRKVGTGSLKIRTDTGDTIRCSLGSGNQIENPTTETYAAIALILEEATVWVLDGTPTGTWDVENV